MLPATHPATEAVRGAASCGPDGSLGYTPYGYHLLMAGYTSDKDAYLKRLRRIEGQVRGIERLVDEDTYCVDVLTQISAATRALQGVALGLMEEHLRHCVADAVAQGGDEAEEKLAEANEAIRRLVRS